MSPCRAIFVVLLSMVAVITAINRPVYKIILTQQGYAQFLQYDVETPPLREFTFCTWIRVFDLANDQSIFTYVANGNNRVIRLWLDSGGEYMKVSILGQVTSKYRVDVVKDVWRHVCLSYQSDFGAWALYLDSRLVSCEAAQSLYEFVLPGGGSVIIGYGTAVNGASNGLEGEIFGANMILASTIERNFSMKLNPSYGQKQFARNTLKKETKDTNYVILSDLMTGEIQNNFEKTYLSPSENTSKSFIKVKTPHSFVEHDVGIGSNKNQHIMENSKEQEFFDFTISDFRTTNKEQPSFMTASQPRFTGKINTQATKQFNGLNSINREVPMVLEYETPPPPSRSSFYFDNTLDLTQQPITESIHKSKDSSVNGGSNIYKEKSVNPIPGLSEIETPPPEQKNTKVYGQWTSSKFAGAVLNYLKSINFRNREQFSRKVPQTIPLYKISDSHPYSSDFKINRLRPPSQFKRRNLVEKNYDIIKRDPQINVQILEDDLRSNILKMHASTHPKKVEITSRGQSKNNKDHRVYRNIQYEQNSDERSDSLEEIYRSKPFAATAGQKNHKYYVQPTPSKTNYHVLSFLKPFVNSDQDSQNTQSKSVSNSNDMYSKSLSNANKWHNVKSYSNDYTPRKINMDSEETETDRKKQYPAIRLKYIHDKRKILKKEDPTISDGRKLAMVVSNQSTVNQDTVSIIKYNHGYLPSYEEIIKKEEKLKSLRKRVQSKRNMESDNFDKHIKIGNALNERVIIGQNEEQKKRSFVGGNENIPDINRYRSDIDIENDKVPPSLGPRICKNVELYDRVLYVQHDGSIDMTHILSPVREKNIAIEFVMQNYKKCSLTDSSFQKNTLLFIDWSKTPVRLFGGAYPKTTTDLCGFF